ncbi:hypothetical protein GCM10011511_31080 [Puia dinghuensis]|uniref:Uncharacterized protein n=2 Tax=Puia dinghuensis TaxID=1792502 RepID=A0A8J2XTQ9_9BACT|nr:hypothetical protein GCM10011511_31080 [Puia dinghuensis]
MQNNNTGLPLISFSTDIYDNFSKRIGVLDKKYGAHAIRFYGVVKFINQLQESRDKHVPIDKVGDFDHAYKTALCHLLEDFYFSTAFDSSFTHYKIDTLRRGDEQEDSEIKHWGKDVHWGKDTRERHKIVSQEKTLLPVTPV